MKNTTATPSTLSQPVVGILHKGDNVKFKASLEDKASRTGEITKYYSNSNIEVTNKKGSVFNISKENIKEIIN